jgi:hypothetical protein
MIFPLATATALPRVPSDHVPILWESGHSKKCGRTRFKFEKWWRQCNEFRDLVVRVWNSKVVGVSAFKRWQNKVRLLGKR